MLRDDICNNAVCACREMLGPSQPRGRLAPSSTRFCAVILSLSLLIAASGCGLDWIGTWLAPPAEILHGRDSAGAAIELEKRGEELTRARVADAVLGTGEAEIISDADGQIEFTVDFPAGVVITYRGRQADATAFDDGVVSGTWRQHPGGVFGTDLGTWEAGGVPSDKP